MRAAPKFGPVLQIIVVCLVWLGVALILPNSNHGLAHDIPRSHFSGPRFVFADLDGDRKPDFAMVETQSARSVSNYSIRLKMSAGLETAIGVDAPLGGLRLVARDVNGDDRLDLVVTSNLDAHYIQVLLNDGSGNFSAAAEQDLPHYLNSNIAVGIHSPASPQADRTTLSSQGSGSSDAILPCSGRELVYSSDPCITSEVRCNPQDAVVTRLGRSPPRIAVS